MKKLIYITAIAFGLFSFTSDIGQNKTHITNFAFDKGEVLTYRLHYGIFNAGVATLKVDKTLHTVKNKKTYRMDVIGSSVGVFRGILKIDDFFRSYVDTESLTPRKFFREVKEGNYYLKEDVFFYPATKKIKVLHTNRHDEKKVNEFSVPTNVHDIISGFYYLRNIDWSSKNKGDKVRIKAFFEDQLFDMEIVYKGKTKVRTKYGKIHAIKLAPIMPDNDLFEGEDAIEFYLSDDKNHVPLKVRAKMFVGAVELDIKAYKNLKYKLNKVK